MQSIQIHLEPEDVNENDYFKVSAYIITESEEIEFLIDVNITFDGQTYIITDESDNHEVKIKAPSVDTDKPFIIYATKPGYKTNYTQITIKNIKPLLKIVPQDYIIPAGDFFYVTVYEYNKDGNTVEGANVYISSHGDKMEITKKDGKAYFYAPTNREEITIIASKLGYTNGNETIKIKPQQNIISQIINNKFFLIFLSAIVLIFAILFVHFRQKKNIYIHAKEIANQKTVEKYASESDDSYEKSRLESNGSIRPPVRVNQDKDSKVEEIRISRPKKEKEIVDIKTKVDDTEKNVNKKKIQRREYEWFEGIDEIRYEIDKLTHEVDEEGKDKWFEGVDDFRKKIDEKIKKKNTKQNKYENKN
ncbi:MAG: hypothetical protein MUO82_10285 [Candidatus Thermoplasmatota archaeon]|nr:hypothetical protein [Candidatus Thermoplasmatota archaeon]